MNNFVSRIRRIKHNPTLTALLGALLVLAISLLLWWQSSRWYEALLLAEQRVEIKEDLSLRGNALSAAVNRRFALVDGLHAFVQANATSSDLPDKFDTFAAGLYSSTPGIRNIALAPAGVIQLVYPMEGNESVVGYDPGQDERSEVRADVQRAIESGEIILSGPVELIQGGQGLILRKAVFQDKSYWGLVNIVLDLAPIVSRAELDSQTSDWQYALRDSNGHILWGSSTIFKEDPAVDRIELPNSFWELAAVSQRDWQATIRRDLIIFQTSVLIVVALVTSLTFLAINRQARLALAVEARTREINQSKLLLERRVEERTKELSALLEVAQTVGGTLEIKPLLSVILSQLKHVVEYSGAAISTLEDKHLVFLDYQGPAPREQILGQRIPLDQPSGYQQVYTQRDTVIYTDLWREMSAEEKSNGHADDGSSIHFSYARSWMGVPLIVKGRFIGVLRVDHMRPHRFFEQDASLVRAFANQAAVAIENARLYEQAQVLASLKERQKLARDLHDSVSQALYGISLGARTARTILDRHPDNLQALTEPLEYLLSLSDAALVEMRALIFELRPEMLHKEGLVGVLSKQAASLRTRHGLKVSTDFPQEPVLSIEVKEDIYRVAQEAINNTIKHARASEVEITMISEGEWLVLEVQDNGQGFNLEREKPGHLGLHSMRERIEDLDGILEINSTLGEGTLIRARIPYQIPNSKSVYE
jgi:signal transduction histidine kinase